MKIIFTSLILSKAALLYLVIFYCWSPEEPCVESIAQLIEQKIEDGAGSPRFGISLSPNGKFVVEDEELNAEQFKAVLTELTRLDSQFILEIETKSHKDMSAYQPAIRIAEELKIREVVLKQSLPLLLQSESEKKG